jgi:hypothetical protein
MVLTTVRDNQSSVQIDLYRGESKEMNNPEYVGTLLVERVEEGPQGEPEISMTIGLDESGNLNATASDAKTGEYQSLSVSLEALSEEDTYDVPDFELDDSSVEELEPSSELEDAFGDESGTDSSGFDEELGEFEQITFEEEDSSEESSGHSYDEEPPELGDLEQDASESSQFDSEFDADQFSEEDDRELSFENEFDTEDFDLGELDTDEFDSGQSESEDDSQLAQELESAEDLTPGDDFEQSPDFSDLEQDSGFAEEPSFGDQPAPETAAAAPAERPDQDEAPFEDGQIPEQYRPESRTNPFVLAGFVVLALAACGIIAYLVYTAIQPSVGGDAQVGFLGLPAWLSFAPWQLLGSDRHGPRRAGRCGPLSDLLRKTRSS